MQAPADYAGCPVTVLEAEGRGRTLVPPRWGLWDVALGLAGAVVLALVVGVALALADAPLAVQLIGGTLAPWLALAGWPVLATRLRGNGPVIDLGLGLTWSQARVGALGGVLALVLATVGASITAAFVPDLDSAAGRIAGDLQQSSGPIALLLFAVIVVVGAPIVEEMFFRGLFYGAVRKRGAGPVLTILITGTVFALFHLEPLRLLVLLPTGLVLGWVRWRTGSTGASIVAHAMVNAPGAVLLLLGPVGMRP